MLRTKSTKNGDKEGQKELTQREIFKLIQFPKETTEDKQDKYLLHHITMYQRKETGGIYQQRN
jgi:hypothetical protein